MNWQINFIKRRLELKQSNLLLIEERMAEFVLPTDVPLQYISAHKKTLADIKHLEEELESLNKQAATPLDQQPKLPDSYRQQSSATRKVNDATNLVRAALLSDHDLQKEFGQLDELRYHIQFAFSVSGPEDIDIDILPELRMVASSLSDRFEAMHKQLKGAAASEWFLDLLTSLDTVCDNISAALINYKKEDYVKYSRNLRKEVRPNIEKFCGELGQLVAEGK